MNQDGGSHRLEAQIQPGNHASLKLVQRLGFRNEGYSPDLLFIEGSRGGITSGGPSPAA